MTIPNYHCPVCEMLSELIISEMQAFCTKEGCDVICFNPSLPDRGLSDMQEVDLSDWWEKMKDAKSH